MTVRVILISPARSALGQRAAVFGGADLPADPSALRNAPQPEAHGLRTGERNWRSPTTRCRETAAAIGVRAAAAEPLADWRTGRWEGRTLDEIAAAEPDAVATWLADPSAAPHGGETLLDLIARAGKWLDGLTDARTTAIAEPAVIRAAMVHALGLPPEVFWRLDVRPLTETELTGRAGRWNLQCGRPLRNQP